MQIYVILIACVVLLLCLFFKVPVFISVFAGALVYFLFRCVLINRQSWRSVLFPEPRVYRFLQSRFLYAQAFL